MKTIKTEVQKALETLALPTKGEATYMQESENSTQLQASFSTLNDPNLKQMLDGAKRFCADMMRGENPHWLSFLGSTGAGKTHLAKQINSFFLRHLEGRLIPNQNLTRTQHRMRGGFVSWRRQSERLRNGDYDAMRGIREDYFVVLDDIGSEYKAKSDFITAKLDEIIDSRLGKWTVITANLSLEQISEHLDVRIASRLLRGGSEVIDVDVPDYNLRDIDQNKILDECV